MAIRFIPTDDEGNGYNIDDDSGDVYTTSGEQLDPSTAEPVYTGPMSPAWDGGGATPNTFQIPKLDEIAKALGLTKEDGAYDWGKIIGLGAAGLTLNDSHPVKTIAQLQAGMPSNTPGALSTVQTPMRAGNQLQRQYAADMSSPVKPGYADGGEVDGPLSQTFDSSQTQGYVGAGEGGGQDDMIDARLSPGEYVFDAESVSMLGDGDNAAGARKLDELREAMRAHKRSAPDDEIAPRSKGPLSYMNGGLNG